MTFRGKTVVITGAASGIGKALAEQLARDGAKLALTDWNADALAEVSNALTDWNADALAEVSNALTAQGAEVFTRPFDISDNKAVIAFADAVKTRFGIIHQLYNVAGIASYEQGVLATDPAEFERVMNINFWGVVHGTKAFLPHLIESGDAALINISSLFGLYAHTPGLAYVSAKFAVRGFTESVDAEMRSHGHKVHVLVVHPGGVATNIVNNMAATAKEGADARTQFEIEQARQVANKIINVARPEEAANQILRAVRKRRPRLVITTQAKLVDFAIRLFPQWHTRMVAWQEKRNLAAVEKRISKG